MTDDRPPMFRPAGDLPRWTPLGGDEAADWLADIRGLDTLLDQSARDPWERDRSVVAYRHGLLDTSMVIDLPDHLDAYATEVGISGVTVGELAFGLHTANPIKAAERQRRYREVLATCTPIPCDGAVAHWFGAIAAAVRSAGRYPCVRTSDLMLAATARHVGAVVLTHNPNDFKGLEAIVEVVAV